MTNSLQSNRVVQTQCCVVGGGPAGMMLGLLLARAGAQVVVLEKHADFLRDFRGDTIHPSTMEIMHELGILEDFLKLPHQKADKLGAVIGGEEVTIADFSHVPAQCKYIVFMPQWDFLDFLADHAKLYPNFTLMLETEVIDIIRHDQNVTGVKAETKQGDIEVRADLVVGADGRGSIVRAKSGLDVMDIGAPMDVLWMRVPKEAHHPGQTKAQVNTGKMLIMIDRNEYWQCGYVIPKGELDKIKEKGLPYFLSDILSLAPFLTDTIHALQDWNDIKLLTVAVNRLKKWHCPGLLCIGDAAHAMSPVGGVGINLAIQDAVAAANILAAPLLHGAVNEDVLQAVQKRREFPAKMTQRIQVFIQNRVIRSILDSDRKKTMSVPFILRVLQKIKWLQRIPARMIGTGIRPEHVKDRSKS